jgi:hypothetical protein
MQGKAWERLVEELKSDWGTMGEGSVDEEWVS